jgi:transporter family protein
MYLLHYGILLGLIAMLGWGIGDTLSGIISKEQGSLKIAVWSQFPGIVLLLALALIYKVPQISAYYLILQLADAAILTLSAVAFFEAMKIGEISIVSPISASWAAFTVILSLLLLGESVDLLQYMGIALAITGTALASFKLEGVLGVRNRKKALGADIAFLSAFGFGIGFFILNVLIIQLGWLLPTILNSVLIAIFVMAYSRSKGIDISLKKEERKPLLWLGIIYVISIIAYSVGITQSYAVIIAPIAAASPVITVSIVILFLKERPSRNQIVGIAAALCGIILLSI